MTKIEVILAPHNAERDDAAMTGMEKEMASLKNTSRAALPEMTALASGPGHAELAAAAAALDRFDAVTGEIIALSRRNTNVRSLDLALRVKPPLTAACVESLRAIAEALRQRADKPLR